MRTAVALLALLALLPGCIRSGGIEPEDFLTDGTYKEWVLEIDAVAGQQPSSPLLRFLDETLTPLVHKDDVRTLVDDVLPAQEGRTWTNQALLALSRERQDTPTEGSRVVTHILFVDGAHEEGGVLGVAFDHDLVVIFSEVIRDACQNPLVCNSVDAIYRAVLLHEMGHILGLVDNGIGMVQDHEADTCKGEADEGHSSNPQSVMYCEVETMDILALLSSGPPQSFDTQDRADLRAAGGK